MAQMYRGVLAHLFLIFIPELQKLQDMLPAQAAGRGLRSRWEPPEPLRSSAQLEEG